MMKKIINNLLPIIIVFVFFSCSLLKIETYTYEDFERNYQINYKEYKYSDLKENIFQICLYCHASQFPNPTIYNQITQVLKKNNPKESHFFNMLYSGKMPKGGNISNEQKQMIYNWIRDGAQNN